MEPITRQKLKLRDYAARDFDWHLKIGAPPEKTSKQLHSLFLQLLDEMNQAEGKQDFICLRLYKPASRGFNSILLIGGRLARSRCMWIQRWQQLTGGQIYSQTFNPEMIPDFVERVVFQRGCSVKVYESGELRLHIKEQMTKQPSTEKKEMHNGLSSRS